MPERHMHAVSKPAGDYQAIWTGRCETARDLRPLLDDLAGPQLKAFTRVIQGRAHAVIDAQGPDGRWTMITWCGGDCQAAVQWVTDQAVAAGGDAYTAVADREDGPWTLLKSSEGQRECRWHGAVEYDHVCVRPGEDAGTATARAFGEIRDA